MAKNNPRENKARRQAQLSGAMSQGAAGEASVGNGGASVADAADAHVGDRSILDISSPSASVGAGVSSDLLSVDDGDFSKAQDGLAIKDTAGSERDKRSTSTKKGPTKRPSVKASKVVSPGLADELEDGFPAERDNDGGSDSEEDVQDETSSIGGADAEGAEEEGAGFAAFQIDGNRVSADKKNRKSKRLGKVIKGIVVTLIVLLLVAAIAAVVAFSVFRWNTYDDAEDIQGTWQVEGSDSTIEITDETITLTDDVAYKYVLDEDAKTISFMFGNLKGQGHYRFSLDRNSLAIIDGEFEWADSLSSDIPWTFDALLYTIQNDDQLSPGEGEGITSLKRT